MSEKREKTMSSNQPNFLFIITDQQRADTSGIPGAAVKAPNLQRLASEGIRFTNTFCTAPHCCPSRASLLTGLYPSQHGIWNNVLNDMALGTDLRAGVRLWNEELQENGYENHFFGKWHVSGTEYPRDRGWIEHTASATPDDRHGLYWKDYQKLAAQENVPRGTGEIKNSGYETMQLFREIDSDEGDHDRVIVDEVLNQLDLLKDKATPWCIYAGLFYPHDPYEVPREYLDRFPLDSIEVPVSIDDEMRDKPIAYRMIKEKVFNQMDINEKRECIRHYYALCSYVDDQIGLLLDKLKQTGMEEDTVVIFCSDHGDYCGEHGLFCKGVPAFDSAYKVPLIIRYPQKIKNKGRSEDSLISLTDLRPTIFDLAGIKHSSEAYPGRSLLPFLHNTQPDNWRESVYMQCNGVELYYTQRIIRTQQYKLVYNGYDTDELYNLDNDPEEMQNLASHSEYQNIKQDLFKLLWQKAYEVGDGVINGYFTVRMAENGPAVAFSSEDQ